VDDLEAAVLAAPEGIGEVHGLERGALRWRMVVPTDGVLPFDGAFPGLIGWQGDLHPCQMLPDVGCRLEGLEIEHPEAGDLAKVLGGITDKEGMAVRHGPVKRLLARIRTPGGVRVLE
jgi:hypothetical protein